ncbi:MAG: hypothetical protein JW838_01400 [Spirochaetes bacterium]|nr:hypothetical protein [Spirochaetota bacterium]
MKRYGTIFCLMFLIIAGSSTSFARVDLSIGGTAWYAWWSPAWSDAKTSTVVYNLPSLALFNEDSRDFRPASNVMAGPMISIAFLQRWSIQTVFTMGKFYFSSHGLSRDYAIDPGTVFATYTYKKYTRETLKWDSDSSIACSLHRMVKLFAGFKWQGYRYEERLHNYFLSETTIFKRVLFDDVRAYGGGIGLGLTIPAVKNFFVLINASALMLWSMEKINIIGGKSFAVSSTDGFYFLPLKPPRGSYLSYGGTASLSLAYVIDAINTTISLGGRYQLLFNRQKSGNPFINDVSMNIIDRRYDHFFGITMSAVYSFHIGV